MCELLEYINTGWPNHPGRPELLNSEAHTNGFDLTIRLHRPDYLGGLKVEELEYNVYFGDTRRECPQFIDTVDGLTDTFIVVLTSKLLIHGVGSLLSIYHLAIQLASKNETLHGIAALPSGSPILVIDPLCDLIG